MLRPIVLASAVLSLSIGPAAAPTDPRIDGGEWPSWRGPFGTGVAAPDAAPPLRWSERENVRWKVELPGLGNGSPAVHGARIYLTSAIDLAGLEAGKRAPAQPGPPQADGPHRFVVLALERASGAIAWETVVREETPHEKGHVTGSHASASITCAGEHLVAFFGSRGLYVLDLAGKVVWSTDLGDMQTLVAFGEGSTPAVHGDTVVVQWDEEGGSFVAAFELQTGRERWRRARATDSSWGSPTVAVVGGRPQVILTGSDTTRAYDLASGEPVWSAGGMSKNPVNTAVVADGLAFVMNNYQGDVIQAIELAAAKGEVAREHGLRWSRARDASYVPTPLVHEGRLYFLRDSVGILSCLDAATGAERYVGARLEGARTVHASPILAAGRIYVTSREGTTVVVRAGDAFEVLARNELEDEFDATPAVAGRELFLRGRSHLYCLAEDG
jgi:outer membrane protein assembly factor BamB